MSERDELITKLLSECRKATCQCPRGAFYTASAPYGSHRYDCHLRDIPELTHRIGLIDKAKTAA